MAGGLNPPRFDTQAWLARIGHRGDVTPGLEALRHLVLAHATAIPFENIDVFLGRVPQLDLAVLQRRMIEGRRGGYCFEQNTLLRAGLTALGFEVTSLLARVIRGLEAEAKRPATHMVLRVDLPEGGFLVDVGFGYQTPTAPLALGSGLAQPTPHEAMRLLPLGGELILQARQGEDWRNLYRVSLEPRPEEDFAVTNWFTATHPDSLFVNHMIVARPGPDGLRRTFLDGRLTLRRPGEAPERHLMEAPAAVLREDFGLVLSDEDLAAALSEIDRRRTRGAAHSFTD